MTPAAFNPLRDQQARDAIRDDLDSTLIVEAAAGTGKTTALVSRILRILATGRTTIGGIVAVTFTEKAAGELKLRLREALERERAAATVESAQRLDEALTNLEEAHVSTIHGFCADLLRERPVEASVDPLFSVLTEAQAERVFAEAFGAWLQGELEHPPEGLRRALRRTSGFSFSRQGFAAADEGPIDRLREAAWELAQWRDFGGPWTKRPFERDQAIDRLVAELDTFADLTESPSYARDNLYLDTVAARHLSQDIRLQRSIGRIDYDGWEARLAELPRNRNFANARHGRGPGYRPGVTRAALVAALEELRAHLDQFRMDADAELAELLQHELRGAVERYGQVKRQSGALDFLDLLLKARNLVRDSAPARESFRRRFTHIFVDEFQDTDPLQAEILLLLASQDPSVTDWRQVVPSPGRLFIVGDPKQSIYRFRRADVAVYREVCERLEDCGAKPVKLRTSFRSVPEIQSFINAAFAPAMTGDAPTLQADYVELSQHRPPLPRQPAIVALPVPEPYGQRQVSMISIEKSLPDAIGAFVEWLIARSKWKVTLRQGAEPENIKAQHVCILFRRFVSFGRDMTQPYVQALEARGIPQILVGGKTFHDREEVETLRAALAAVEWPDDELSVFATLHGTLFSIGDEELLEWRHRFGRAFHPFRVPVDLNDAAHLKPIADALEVLQRLHRRRNYIPVAETIQQLLTDTRAHVGLVLRSGGEQALANVLHVAELARQYEQGGGISFRGFVDELRTAAETAQAAEAPVLEEGSDGVRLMTVHKAKGLEFPIVILADPTCKLSRVDAGRWIDAERHVCALRLAGLSPIDLLLHGAEELARERAEAVRLTYVAATRARDVLVVPVLGDGAYEGGWLDPLMAAIYPSEADRRKPSRAPGCPDFPSKDSVLSRPDSDPARSFTVAPGLHRFSGGIRSDTAHPASRPSTLRQAQGRPEPSRRTTSSGRPEPAEGRTPHSAPDDSHSASRIPHLGGYSVVWWDPHALALGVESTFGLRRDDLIVKDGDMFAVEDKLAAYERWRDERVAIAECARQPSLAVDTVTSWARTARPEQETAPASSDPPIEMIGIPGIDGRPYGPRFGTLVHALLATMPLEADAAMVSRIAETHARILAATAAEAQAAAQIAMQVAQHPLIARAAAAIASHRCFRETPLTWRAPDGTLIEGTIDLAFEDEDGFTVLDFKTDREVSTDVERYRRQLTIYCRALSALKGRPARGVLMKV